MAGTAAALSTALQGVGASSHAPSPARQPSPDPQNTGTVVDPNYRKKTHLAKPAVFNGQDFRGWWRSVSLYILGNDRDFTTDQDKILFALSFMTEGGAEQWSQNFCEAAIEDDGFGTWKEFIKELKKSFENKNQKREAQAALDRLVQGKQTAEEFFMKFELLRREAGFVEQEHHAFLIGLLEKNVDDVLIDHIYDVTPLPDDYEVWKEKIIAFDSSKRRRAAVKAMKTPWRSYTPATSTPRPAASTSQAAKPTTTFVPTPQQSSGGGGRLYGGMGQPMDLDESRRKGLCFSCGQQGHISRFCPNKRRPAQVRQQEQVASFDVRELDHDGMKRLVTEWQTARDAKYKAEQDRQETDKLVSDFSKA